MKLDFMRNTENFFDEKIQLIKDTVSNGIDQCFRQFSDKLYFSYLQSYFYLQKYYGMIAYQAQLWTSIKRAIKETFVNSYREFERVSSLRFYVSETERIGTVQRLFQIPKGSERTLTPLRRTVGALLQGALRAGHRSADPVPSVQPLPPELRAASGGVQRQ